MLEKERGEVDFLHLDKHETSLQVDAINLGDHDQTCQIASLQLIFFLKKSGMKLNFCAVEHQNSW